eukprot:976800-Rhodomonas_salina.2
MKFGTGIAVRNAIFRIERVFPSCTSTLRGKEAEERELQVPGPCYTVRQSLHWRVSGLWSRYALAMPGAEIADSTVPGQAGRDWKGLRKS